MGEHVLQELIFWVVFFVIATVFAVWYVRANFEDAQETLSELYDAAGVRADLVPAEAQAWLQVEVKRRERCVETGLVVGLVAVLPAPSWLLASGITAGVLIISVLVDRHRPRTGKDRVPALAALEVPA